MDKKPLAHNPADSIKNQRIEVYIGDLQKRLHQLRNKYDNIFIECCDILKNIQEVSNETITKQQEIGRIIREFEDIGMKNSSKDTGFKKALIQKAGEVKRLREKFESVFQNNLNSILLTQNTNFEVEKNCVQYAVDNVDSKRKPIGSAARDTAASSADEMSNAESYYEMLNESARQDAYKQ